MHVCLLTALSSYNGLYCYYWNPVCMTGERWLIKFALGREGGKMARDKMACCANCYFRRKSQLARDNCSNFFFLINQLGLQAMRKEKASYAMITIGRQCCFENFFPCLWCQDILWYSFTWHDKPLTSSLLCKWCTLLYLYGTERIFYFWLALYQDRGYDLQIHYKVSTGHFSPFTKNLLRKAW